MTSKDKTIRKIEFLKAEMKTEQEQYGRNSLHTKLKLKYLEEVLKDLETLEILKPYLKQVVYIEETGGGLAMSFKPTTFYIAKVMDLDFNFNDTEKIENIRKVKEWLENGNSK